MKKHFQYLNYVVRHKWFVFRAGLKTGAPLWRLIVHDWSKFSWAEWRPYVNTFYGNLPREETKEPFCRAWLHHQHKNPHHWQHWVLRQDDGDLVLLEIPEGLMCEMVADWMGAGRTITGKWEVREWYEKNKHKIQMHPHSQVFVEHLIEEVS